MYVRKVTRKFGRILRCFAKSTMYVCIRVLFRVIPYDNVAFVIILPMNFGTVAGRIV